ncbi:MAG: hypothetical protein J7498_05910 [Sphingobium sp.]|nr:hypothetical protein [Sphingobium sp.]
MAAIAARAARVDAFVETMMNEIGATKGWALFNLGLAASVARNPDDAESFRCEP